MQHRTHIATTEIAHAPSARANRSAGMIRSRHPRDVRIVFVRWHPSGESEVMSFPRERDGVPERDVWTRRIARYPSGESVATSISRERDGVPERDVRSRRVARHPSCQRATHHTGSSSSYPLVLEQSFTNRPCTTSRCVQPATSRAVSDFFGSLSIHRVSLFRPRW